MIFNEELDRLATLNWRFARKYLWLCKEFQSQVTLVPADEDGDLIVAGEPKSSESPYDFVRRQLVQHQAQAFVVVGEAWHVLGESLMLVALGHDYTLQRTVNFERRNGRVTFAPEEDCKVGSVKSRFLDLRELLVRPRPEHEQHG